jgi:extracellular factor (EF) 3-hydroxypalmitic acid methyl ester biosynthesis protein
MEIYNPHSIVQVSEVLSELTIRSGDRSIYKGKAVVVSLLNTGLMAVVSVTLIDEWNELSGLGTSTQSVSDAVTQFITEWDHRIRIGHEYQVIVNDMRAYFSEVTRWLDQADLNAGLPRKEDGRVRDDVFYEIARPLLEKGREYLLRFEEVAKAIPPEEEAVHRAFAQAAMHPLILRSPFVYRTFAKPLGYAGDYQMVNQILSDPRDGPSTYFEMVNFMFLQAGVAQGHRNRVEMLEAKLKGFAEQSNATATPFRILNVGCGPAAEIQHLAAGDVSLAHLDIELLDFSEETLRHTKERILAAASEAKQSPPNIRLRHESVHQLLKRSSRDTAPTEVSQYDFIYCAGLFDYLADKACVRLIAYFERHLKPGGSLLVTNVHVSNPERYWMEHFMEWYLIYRDEAGMEKLIPESLENVSTYTDVTGINVFAEASKP